MSTESERKLTPYLSPAAAWAFSLGTSIGWGSLVITSSTYLSQAGPMGSTIGMVIGGLIMLVIAHNYCYMMNCYPEAGGAYAYSREVFGYDYGFLTAWFLALTYLSMFWANTTSLPLFARYFVSNFFQFGYLYTIFGYQVYLGEALLSILAILLVVLLCIRQKKAAAKLMTGMVFFFTVGILFCFLYAVIRLDHPLRPSYIPDKNEFSQVIKIACISPWAFIGFENISHFSEEFHFPRKKLGTILTVAVISTTLLYICITLLSITAYPPEYSSWLEYIRDLDNLSGITGLPAFYAAYRYLSDFGVSILMLCLLSLVITSLIGNIAALSRLFYAMGKDRILPRQIGSLNEQGIPRNAVLLIAVVSVFIPFIGRTAIGWIVDVTTIGATLIYGFVSAATLKMSRARGDKTETCTGMAGLICMIAIELYLLIPNIVSSGSMAPETYLLFVVWAILGFIFFRIILQKDTIKRFGKSVVVWIALLALILFISLIWMSQSSIQATGRALANIQEYYHSSEKQLTEEDFLAQETDALQMSSSRTTGVAGVLFIVSLWILISNYSIMNQRALESELELGNVKNRANKDPLTGVKSKHAYAEKEEEINALLDSGTMSAFSLVVCDVNGLKYVNDTYGHKAGDEHIRAAARMICELFQHSPVYRIGGDEFLVLLVGRDHDSRETIMKALNDLSEEHIQTEDVVVAAGLSDYIPGEDLKMHTVFERADARMYQRKKELKQMGAHSR